MYFTLINIALIKVVSVQTIRLPHEKINSVSFRIDFIYSFVCL